MFTRVNSYDFRRGFETLRPNSFSYEGLGLLFEYFEELEESIGEEIEFDVIAICCDWAESTPDEIRNDFGLEDMTDDDGLLDYLHENTSVAGVTSEGTIVYQSF